MVASYLSLWATALAVASVLLAPASAAGACHCYLTNGSTPQYLVNHQFLDFRSIASPRITAPIKNRTLATKAGVTHPYFNSTAFANTWSVQAWVSNGPDATVWNTYSKNDVYVAANADARPASSTYMTMRTYRHPAANGNFQESAEIQTLSPNYKYLSMRMYARTRGSTGAVTAMFTYRGGATDADVQEADLEVLTRENANQAHYTNQPSTAGGVSRPNATNQVAIPTWTAWRTHRYDWSAGMSTWYVDGRVVNQNSYQVPKDPATLLFNVWSDGGGWSKVMPVGGSAAMDVQWIEILYNNTDYPTKYAHCANVCSIDRGTAPGVTALISSGP
ncbi:glycoside hydrolase family 16 protein [Hypoxylon rubiginosum]|uniref:Glycoside hydrolase family 16 protein n=1 Tax=Hypoxylon rubiginosum TaxID=110542 RepID=A0ACB9YP86_9PEZI|nr:glycoside hydrolase family 16 protein [Hypoxylon rubiginosum]